jgi:hypothetical protein
MMHGGSGGKIGGRGTGGDNSYNRHVHTSINHGGRRRPMAAMGPHSRLLSIQQSANILWNSSTLLKIEKLSFVILINYTNKAQRIGKLSCLFVAGLNRCTADAEHQWQHQRHIYIVYVPPHTLCLWFGMLAMFRAMAAEVW